MEVSSVCAAVSFPRIRGDVPQAGRIKRVSVKFSPHTRGCFCRALGYRPTRTSFPRIRGDVPRQSTACPTMGVFSPHTRGCSFARASRHHGASVFPAYAGMFRAVSAPSRALTGFPRIRGDVPDQAIGEVGLGEFSPHTRGCSSRVTRARQSPSVFPAYAGMFRLGRGDAACFFGFPRIRGDVPLACLTQL